MVATASPSGAMKRSKDGPSGTAHGRARICKDDGTGRDIVTARIAAHRARLAH